MPGDTCTWASSFLLSTCISHRVPTGERRYPSLRAVVTPHCLSPDILAPGVQTPKQHRRKMCQKSFPFYFPRSKL